MTQVNESMDPKASSSSQDDKEISLTFMKGLEVICAFDADDSEMTIPQIARKTGINRSAVRRLVTTLVRLGYLEGDNRVFRPTPQMLRLSHGFVQGRQIEQTVLPLLRRYSASLGEAISFAMLDGQEAVFVGYAPGDPKLLSVGFPVGSRLPLLTTGIGRALLAFASPELRDKIVANAPIVGHAETNRDEIANRLRSVATKGYAFVDGEFERGVSSLAVPVLRGDGWLIGALGIVRASPHLATEPDRMRRVDSLRECAAAIASLV